MKAKELIKKLKQLDPEMEVQIHSTYYQTNDSGTSFDIDQISEINSVGTDGQTAVISVDYSPVTQEYRYGNKKRLKVTKI